MNQQMGRAEWAFLFVLALIVLIVANALEIIAWPIRQIYQRLSHRHEAPTSPFVL